MTARYLLDTNLYIHVRRRVPNVLKRFMATPAHEMAMSVVSFGELAFGRSKSPQRDKSQLEFEATARVLQILPLPVDAADHYGDIRALLSRNGSIIGGNDLWIAAHARASKLIVVTGNMREFRRVPGLMIEDWTQDV